MEKEGIEYTLCLSIHAYREHNNLKYLTQFSFWHVATSRHVKGSFQKNGLPRQNTKWLPP